METKVEKPKKDLHYKLRMTSETRAKIEALKAKYNVKTTAEFLTQLLTTGEVNSVEPDHKRVMAGIGTNLNQISKSLNIAIKNGWEFPKDLMERLAKIEEEIYK